MCAVYECLVPASLLLTDTVLTQLRCISPTNQLAERFKKDFGDYCIFSIGITGHPMNVKRLLKCRIVQELVPSTFLT